MTQLLQKTKHFLAEMGSFLISGFRKPPGVADVMRKAALALINSVLINPIIVTDQNALPMANQFIERFTGPVWMNQIKCRTRCGHHP
jgi:hypothetical protein